VDSFPFLNCFRLAKRFFFAEDVPAAIKRALHGNIMFINMSDNHSQVFVYGDTAGGVGIATASFMTMLNKTVAP
jgi:hypothetical protein